MTDLKGKTIIITGASSGIGEATARELAPLGMNIMLAARREERLQQLARELEAAGGKARYVACDVTNRSDVDRAVAETVSAFGRVDALFANAGVMLLAPMEKRNVDEWDQMIDVNLKGLLYGIAAVLPQMRKQGAGHIINTASIAGHKVFNGAAVYCATKFAVRALSEGLRAEIGDKIRTTVISPGAIATELGDHITDDEIKQNMQSVFEIALPPDSIARAVKYALEQPPEVDVNEITVRPTAQSL